MHCGEILFGGDYFGLGSGEDEFFESFFVGFLSVHEVIETDEFFCERWLRI
jgi:hypothetical protein